MLSSRKYQRRKDVQRPERTIPNEPVPGENFMLQMEPTKPPKPVREFSDEELAKALPMAAAKLTAVQQQMVSLLMEVQRGAMFVAALQFETERRSKVGSIYIPPRV